MTPRKAIRIMCKECVGGDISICSSPNCKLYPYRMSKTEGKPKLSSLASCKAHCFECTGYEKVETINCTDLKCPLYPFRLGKNPRNKGNPNPDQRGLKPYKKTSIEMTV